MQTCILPNLLVEVLLVVQSLGCLKEANLSPRGEESDISPEVDDVMVVAVVVVVIRELVPRKNISSETFSASESESLESPVKGTERIWLARWNIRSLLDYISRPWNLKNPWLIEKEWRQDPFI